MKRLLTYLSAIIIMMMVPIGVSAWTSINLRGGSYDWNNNSSGSDFKKWDDNNFVKAVTPSTTGNYYFRYYVNDDGGFQCGPDDADNDWLLTVNGTDLTTATKGKTTKAFYFAATAGETYYISVRYVSSTWKVSVSNKPIVRIGGCIGGQNYSWDNDKAPYMAYDSTEDAWYYDVSASDFSSWKRSGEGLIGLDFRFREVNGEQLYYVFSTGSENNAHTTLTSTYQELASNTSGADNRFVGVEEVANATNYRVWYKNDNGTRKAKVEVTTSAPVTTTATLTIGGNDITGTNNGSNYYFDIPADKYTAGSPMSFTLKTETGGTATYYTGDFTGSASGDAFHYATSTSEGTMSYSVPSNATGLIRVSLLTGSNEVVFAYQTSGGGGTSTGYYLVGDLNAFGRPYNDVDWDGKSWGDYGAVNKVLKFKDNGNGTYSLRIPAAHPAENEDEWDKPSKEKQDVSHQFVIAPEDAFSGTEYSGDLYTVGDDNAWKSAWGLTIPDWSKVLRPNTDNKTLDNANTNGNMTVTGGNDCWEVKMNGGSYTITINPTAGTWSVTNDNLTHVMYVITKQDGYWRASYLTDVTTGVDQAHNHEHGNSGELSEFPNESGSTVYVAHNWYEHGSNKKFSTKEHLTIFGAWNTNGDLAPVTWINATSGATAKSIFPTAGKYSTAMDPTRGTTGDVTQNSQKIITNNNQPSIGNIVGAKGDAALISPDATLSPETTTYDNYTLNTAVSLTVTMNSYATAYKYSYGAGTTPSTEGTSTTFGDLSYDGTGVKLGSTVVASGTNTVTICIQGTDGANDGAVHEYTYTFNPTATVTATINTTGGLYINKVLVNVAYTGDSSTPLYWKVGGAPTTSDNLVSYTDDENNVSNRKFLLSTPGQLYVGDGTNTSDPVTFDFTYSTSENYVGVEKNGTVSQIVTSKGGKDCVNVFFKKSYKDMSIYVWDANAESGKEYLTKVWPGQWMSDDRTLTLNGETFYYVSFPTSDLKPKDGKYKIGFILSNAALGSSKENADATKTRDYFLEFNATDTNVQGVQETMFYALEANVTANKVYEPAGSTYESQEKSTYKGSAAQLFSTNTVYFKNDANWTSPIYCHVWNSDRSLYDWNSNNNGEMMTLVDETNQIYAYTIPADYQYMLLFSTSDRASKTGDLTFSGNGGKMYTASTSEWVDAPSSFTTLDAASQAVMNTFLTTPPVTTVESRVYPNGQDYYRNMPNDYTLMLSNTWKHADEPPVVDEQHQESSWQVTSGKHWSGDTNKTYLHIRKNEAYQTVTNLPAGTYTVQAIVRGGGVPVYMKLNDTQVASIILTSDGSDAKTTINQFGRSEQLVEMSTDNTKRGWHKLEGSITLATPGDLKIAVRTDYTADGGSIDLADVFLLKDANTPGNYWTTAPTSETVTWYDMSDRSNYNAFSFFDRGANLNSIIKASDKTVIGMSEANEPYAESGRRHPCNVVTSSGSTWSTPMLALTDYASVIVGSENKYGGNPLVSQHAYGTSFAYTADKFSYDRATSAKMMSTMLPFPLTRSQIESMLGSGVKTYIYGGANKTTYKVTFSETSGELAANTPFFFRPVEAKTSMVLNQPVSVPATPAAAALAEGIVGTYKHTSNVGTYYKNKNFIPYFFQDGSFVWAQDNANAKPFRVVFLLGKDNEARVLNVIFEDDAVTAIDGIAETNIDAAPVYSVDGKLVSSNGDISHLTKGVYVKAGKKFIIK